MVSCQMTPHLVTMKLRSKNLQLKHSAGVQKKRKSFYKEQPEPVLLCDIHDFLENYRYDKTKQLSNDSKDKSLGLKLRSKFCFTRRVKQKSASPFHNVHSTPLVTKQPRPSCQAKQLDKVRTENKRKRKETELFIATLSPITVRHNSLERMKQDDLIRKRLLEKSLDAVIAEAKKEIVTEQLKMNCDNDYVDMTMKSNKVNDNHENYVDDDIFEDILFDNNNREPTKAVQYEPVIFCNNTIHCLASSDNKWKS